MRYWVGRGEGGGEGGEKVNDKRQKETRHKQEGLQVKGKGGAVEKRRCPLSEGTGTTGKAHRGEGVGGAGAGGGAVKKGGAKWPHNRQRSVCKECGGVSIYEYNRQRSGWEVVGTSPSLFPSDGKRAPEARS